MKIKQVFFRNNDISTIGCFTYSSMSGNNSNAELETKNKAVIIEEFGDIPHRIVAIVKSMSPNISYHRLGQAKYEYLGREYSLDGVKLDVEKEKDLRKIIEN